MSESESCVWMETVQGKKRKRRFSEEQIRSLESMFESHGKLDQKKKQQLAGELGLDPRQVAIWFQNRRARCKSKNLEGDYAALRADYDALLFSFESLNKEKQALAKQLQMLTELLQERPEERRKDGDSSSGGGKEDFRAAACSDDNVNVFNNLSEEDADHTYMGGIAGDVSVSASTSAELELGLEPSWRSDQPFNSSQWWEFWPMNE